MEKSQNNLESVFKEMSRTKVTVKAPDFDKWKSAVQEELIDKIGASIIEHARAIAPRSEYGNDNHYMDNINYYRQSNTMGVVIAENHYSADIEYGTKAHIIEPVTAKALHFKKDGKEIFTKKVEHPGTRPNPVMRNAAAQVQKEIKQIWQEVQRANGL